MPNADGSVTTVRLANGLTWQEAAAAAAPLRDLARATGRPVVCHHQITAPRVGEGDA